MTLRFSTVLSRIVGSLAATLHWTAAHHFGIKHMVHLAYDFLLTSASPSSSLGSLERLGKCRRHLLSTSSLVSLDRFSE